MTTSIGTTRTIEPASDQNNRGRSNSNSNSPWSPLRVGLFRSIWIASLVSTMGVWMHSVAAAWFMTSLTTSPLLVALLQTATSLPVLIMGLPAGAIADLVDRRIILLVAHGWLLVASGVLAALTMAGMVDPWTLLGFTFALGLGVALVSPVWQALTPELIDADELPAAIAINSLGFNITRAAGPAIGGLVVAASGPGLVFAINAAAFLLTLFLLLRWNRKAPESDMPVEHFTGAMRAGLRYIRYSPVLRSMLVRTGVFIVFASGIWTLLPVLASKELKLDASGLGLLQGCLGIGALIGAFVLPGLKERYTIDHLVAGGTVVFALVTLAVAYFHSLFLLLPVLVFGGAAWLVVTSLLNFAAITYAPKWVQARALAFYMLVFQSGMAVGSIVWGILAENFGVSVALTVAAAGMLAGLLTMLRWRLHRGTTLDLRPSRHWSTPDLAEEPDMEAGPVLVTVEYRIKSEDVDNFLMGMFKLSRARRRIGAARWDLFRDPCDQGRFVETFLVESWSEHLRQCQRVTHTDREIEEKVYAYHQDDGLPAITRLVGARPYSARSAQAVKK